MYLVRRDNLVQFLDERDTAGGKHALYTSSVTTVGWIGRRSAAS